MDSMSITITKQEIINWLETEIRAAETRRLEMLAGPCLEGAKLALMVLKEDAKPTEVKSVSKGEIDKTIQDIEEFERTYHFSEQFKPLIHTLLKYVKTTALMPPEPDDSAAYACSDWCTMPNNEHDRRNALEWGTQRYKALYNYLAAPPKPKMKKVWCFSATFDGKHQLYKFDKESTAHTERDFAISATTGVWKNISPIWEQEVEDK